MNVLPMLLANDSRLISEMAKTSARRYITKTAASQANGPVGVSRLVWLIGQHRSKSKSFTPIPSTR